MGLLACLFVVFRASTWHYVVLSRLGNELLCYLLQLPPASTLDSAVTQAASVLPDGAQGMQLVPDTTQAASAQAEASKVQQQAVHAAEGVAAQGAGGDAGTQSTGADGGQQRGGAANQQASGASGTVDDLYLCPDKLANATIVEQLPQLKIEQVLDSGKPRSAQDVTLVTQLSFERLYMLEGQCDVWNGVISAAVYIALLNGRVVTVELNSNQDPRLTDIAEVQRKFKQFHQLAEAKGARLRGAAGCRQPECQSPGCCSSCHMGDLPILRRGCVWCPSETPALVRIS
jgi:hypothetical protein